jgi:hypothetical protein
MSESAPSDQDSSWWTLAEVSSYFREDPLTTRRRIQRGELSPVTLPGSRKLLFRGADVVAFAETQSSPVT